MQQILILDFATKNILLFQLNAVNYDTLEDFVWVVWKSSALF